MKKIFSSKKAIKEREISMSSLIKEAQAGMNRKETEKALSLIEKPLLGVSTYVGWR